MSRATKINGSTSTSFGAAYASIYDALYQEKNYPAEARFVLDQLRSVLPHMPRHILDLGCGSGLHAVEIAQTGISVTGVDRSPDMIAVAERHKESRPDDERGLLQFRIGDIRTIDFDHKYDAVTSLFHVFSYLNDDDDVDSTLRVARQHLIGAGALMFDFWYAPAVLQDPPQAREKSFQIGDLHIFRKAFPEWDREHRIICVNYDIEIKNSATGETLRETEQHFIRYYFPNEIERFLTRHGFEVIRFGEALTGRSVSGRTFSVYVLAKAK